MAPATQAVKFTHLTDSAIASAKNATKKSALARTSGAVNKSINKTT